MKTANLSQYQAFNSELEPVIRMEEFDQEALFKKVADRIEAVFEQKSKTKLVELDEETTEERAFHPASTAVSRGLLQPCKFFISPFYRQTTLWRYLADVLVELHDHPSAEEVYLIPSGVANPQLRHSRYLKRDPTGEWLEKKRRATIGFIEAWRNRVIDGELFTMQTKKGDRTKVYSLAYDKFLNATLPNAASEES